MKMEKRIALEIGNLDKSEVTYLNLDHCKSSTLCGLTKDYIGLESLSLINIGLTTLEGFPPLQKLRKLELADNFLSGGFEVLESCPNLQKINLSGNKIKDVECLRPLSKLASLVSLDLFSNEITSSEAFPDNVKKVLPNVQSFCEDELEGLSSGEEEEDGGEEGGEDEYEDEGDGGSGEEEDDEEEGDEDDEIQPLTANGAQYAEGGKSGPSTNGVPGDENSVDDGEFDDEVGEDEEDASDFDDDDDLDDEDDDDGEEANEGPGLEYLYKKDLNDEDDDIEYRASSRKLANGSKEGIDDSDVGPTAAKQKKVERVRTTHASEEDEDDEENNIEPQDAT